MSQTLDNNIVLKGQLKQLNDPEDATYFFHQQIKESEEKSYYVVEDFKMPVPDLSKDQYDVFFVIKQEFFDTKRELDYAADYYNKVMNFSQSPL